MKVFFLELLITKFCNQTCSYCNVYPTTKFENNPEVDIDFLNKVLDYFDYENMFMEICGGEPGCVQNLDEVFKTLYNHKNVKGIQVMSNGLVRQMGYDWITNKKVIYNEHLVKDIDDKNVNKFYSDLDFEKIENRKYVIVTSEKTITSLIDNFDYYKNLGMFDDMFWYKLMVDKKQSITNFHNKLKEFYIKINQSDLQSNLKMLEYFTEGNKNNITQKTLCAINSPQPGIDFETKEILHCSAFLDKTKRVEFNKTNCKNLMTNGLFNTEDYCESCYIFDYTDKKVKCLIKCLNGLYTNRSYWYDKF